MGLRIYNTLSREKEEFTPIQHGRVNIYVCGPTVYDAPHIGHAKSYISFDIVVRYLRHVGFDVLYVQNITDVGHLVGDVDEGESKVEKRARERRLVPMALVETCTRQYFEAMDSLGVLRPDISPRATGHIPEMIELIERLIAAGHAYEADGNVYFSVETDPDYGRLSRRRLDDQEAGSRVEPGAGKRNPADFALWKNATGSGHLMNWRSPWSVGYPGWHIECSAMAMKYLGETLDIHGAGVDNIFPHNEGEVAQSECATCKPFVRYWMHNGSILVGGEKMSKSKGNFKTIESEIARHGAMVLRYWVLTSHYRSPVDYTDLGMEDAKRAFDRLQTARREAQRYLGLPESGGADPPEPVTELVAATAACRRSFTESMDDDFNTPGAIASLFGLASEMNRITAAATARGRSGAEAVTSAAATMDELAEVLGLTLFTAAAGNDNDLVEPLVDLVLKARQSLRGARDYAGSDALRDALTQLGIVVEDRPGGGSTWRRA